MGTTHKVVNTPTTKHGTICQKKKKRVIQYGSCLPKTITLLLNKLVQVSEQKKSTLYNKVSAIHQTGEQRKSIREAFKQKNQSKKKEKWRRTNAHQRQKENP